MAVMAPTRGLSTLRALKVKIKKSKNLLGHGIGVFLTDLHHILHARSCNHFLQFPHTPKPPRPLKRPKNLNLFFAFIFKKNVSFVGVSFRTHLGYGYTSRGRGHVLVIPEKTLQFLLQRQIIIDIGHYTCVRVGPFTLMEDRHVALTARSAVNYVAGIGSRHSVRKRWKSRNFSVRPAKRSHLSQEPMIILFLNQRVIEKHCEL